MDKGEIEKTIKAYEENGIVTREDVRSMDSYACSKVLLEELQENLKKHSCSDRAELRQIGLPGYFDYSNVIYNKEKYSYEEIKRYMFENVLHDID